MARPRGLRRLALLLGIFLAACDDIVGPDSDAERLLQTDASYYAWEVTKYGAHVTIPYVFENLTGTTVYVSNCNGSFSRVLQKLVDGEWRTVWSPILPLCLSDPIEIAPGAQVVDTIVPAGSLLGATGAPEPDLDDLPGVHRIVWGGVTWATPFATPDSGTEPLPFQYRVSNQFQTVVEPSTH